MSDNPLKPMKLFPRNLTAHADVVVRGNPVTTRPESGVENSWPGLEFDHRNMEKAFFPGLLFEYHDDRGTILREFDPKGPAAKFLKPRDIGNGIYLAFVQGLLIEGHKRIDPALHTYSFIPPAGLENWRVVRDFEPGPVAVALCNKRIYDSVLANNYSVDYVAGLFKKRKNRRDTDFVLLFGERAEYVDADGVIDTTLFPPGHLTRSMCSPWQYDFTDCGCFFWASNKPDMVASETQPLQILNFQRRDRSGDAERTPTDWILKDNRQWDNINMLRHVDIINHFDRLKFVIDGRERDDYVLSPPPTAPRLLTRQEVIDRLKVLAGVEHALCVEYLYAYYSLKLPPGFGPKREPWEPPGRPPNEPSVEARIFTAADEVLRVAIDEMRHFRWVNDMLDELGEHWVLDRAEIIGINFPEMTTPGFNRKFELKPLTAETLDWFIQVEKASPHHLDPGTVDGMYTRILLSIEQGSEFQVDPDKRDRLAHFVKLIIDEGVDHFTRFTRVKDALDGISESEYLRVTDKPTPAAPDSDAGILQATADSSYAVLLHALQFVFKQGKRQRGALLEAARRGMYNIDEACRALSESGKGALFSIAPARTSLAATRTAGATPMTAHDVGDPLRPQLARMRSSNNPKLRVLADRMEGKLAELTATLERASE